jgi:hypothetical protein
LLTFPLLRSALLSLIPSGNKFSSISIPSAILVSEPHAGSSHPDLSGLTWPLT